MTREIQLCTKIIDRQTGESVIELLVPGKVEIIGRLIEGVLRRTRVKYDGNGVKVEEDGQWKKLGRRRQKSIGVRIVK